MSVAPSPPWTRTDQLLEVCRRHNAATGITGVLLYGGQRFLQLLEGTQSSVVELYATIQNDARHTDVIVVNVGVSAARQFASWSMVFRDIDANPIEGFGDLLLPHNDPITDLRQPGRAQALFDSTRPAA